LTVLAIMEHTNLCHYNLPVAPHLVECVQGIL